MSRLPEHVGAELVGLAPARSYGPGSILIRQGDTDDVVFLLRSVRPTASACVKITATLENGTESLLGIRVSGDVVGELAAVRRTTRSATATMCTFAEVHVIGRDGFLAFLNRRPEAWQAVAHMIADRLDWANQRRLDFAAYGVPVRLARVIIGLVRRHGVLGPDGHGLGVRLSQSELGRLIGAGEDAVRQAVRQLRSKELIKPRYRELVVTDLNALREFADL